MKSVTPKKKQPVKARKTTSNEIIWLETEHFCHDEHNHVLLRWDRPSGPVYRTGYWHDAKLKYVGSGDVEFRTQPDYLSVLEPIKPVFIIPDGLEAYDAMVEQCASIIFVPLTAPKGDTNRIARSVLAAIGITKPVNAAAREKRRL